MAASPRRWWWIGGAVIVAIAAWLVVRPAGVLVDVAPVTRAPLEVQVVEAGETRAVNHTLVTAPVSGLLQPLVRDAGQWIDAGALLARVVPAALDTRSRDEARARAARADAQRTRALAAVRSADSTLSDARRAEARVATLARAGAVAPRDAEQATLALTAAEDAYRMATAAARDAEAELRAARAVLSDGGDPVAVQAPVRGRVLTVHARDARVVAAGTPILELGDVDAIEVQLEVLSRDALRVAPGQAMRLDFGPGLEAVPGEVLRVEPGGFAKRSPLGVEERRVRVVGRATQRLPDVGDGYRVQATVVVWRADSVLQVPASAFVRDADGWAVYVVEDGRIRRRAVTPGERGAQAWAVREGLDEGDAVIRFPDATVAEGTRARIVP